MAHTKKPTPADELKTFEEEFRGKTIAPDIEAIEALETVEPFSVIRDRLTGRVSDGSFPGGFGPGDLPLSDLPNYEKLTRTERSIQGFLAGNANSPVAQTLGKLNQGFLGKVFTVLDAGAEFIERTAGLSAQALSAVGTEETWAEFTNNLRNAWDAGTFAADFANFPIRENGQIVINQDLPGIEGVISARKRLTELTVGGMSHDEALELVRAEVYENAGALALRMQLHDAFVHIVGDPINLFLPRLRLIDRGKIALLKRATAKRVPDLVEGALKSIDESVATGKMSKEVAEGGRDFIKGLPDMTPWDERWLKLSGALDLNGRPGEILKSSELTGLAKFLRGRWNPAGLTPASRAHGLAVNLTDNVVASLAHITNPDEAVRLVMAAADGTFDPRIAHMVITHEGSMARGLLQGFSAEAQKLSSAYEAVSPNRTIFNFLTQSMGDDGADLLYRMLKSDEMQPIFTKAIESLGDNQDDFIRLLEASGIDPNITPEKLFEIFEPLAKGGMLNEQTFIGRLINEIGDFAAQGAATKFGVPARGFIAKMADLMKSAESMAFLRINPGYFVRNLVNGEMTMPARGIFRFLPGRGKKLLERIGISPTRLRAGFGIAGDVPAHYKKVAGGQEAIKAIDDAILAASNGDPSAMTRLADRIRGVDLGPFDMGSASAKVESHQSFYATTSGIFDWMAKHHEAPDMPRALVDALGESRAAGLKKAVASSLNDAEIEAKFLKPASAGLNPRAVMDDASAAFGEDITRTIKAHEAQAIADDLIAAYNKSGASGVQDEVVKMRGEITQRYSAALKEATSDIERNIIDHVQNGGIDSALHYHSGMLGEFWGTLHAKYVDEFGGVFEQIKAADPKIAGALWDGARTRARTFWDEGWDLFGTQSRAITKGLKAWGKDAGQTFPHLDDYGRTFKTWQGGWGKFYKVRDSLIDEWVEARKAGKEISYTTIKSQIDEAYGTAAAIEEKAFGQLDELMSQYVPEDFRQLYMAGRNEISGIRQAMREHVKAFQVDPLGDGRAYIDLDRAEQTAAYQGFWRDRHIYLDQITDSEKKSRAAMFGDLEARASYGDVSGVPVRRAGDLEETFLAQYDEVISAAAEDAERTLPSPEPGKASEFLERLRGKDPDDVIRVLGDADLDEAARLAAGQLGIDIDEFKSALFTEILEDGPTFTANALPDAEGTIGRIVPVERGLYELWNMKGSKVLDAIGDSVIERGKLPPIKLNDLDEAGQAAVRSYITQSKANLSSSRYQAIKFGEWRRDSALLNYNRRLNYNTWLGTLMPFEFWTTTSIRKWALHTLNRPTMTSLYLRLQDFLDKGYRPEQGLPNRLRGQFRVNAPFLPDFLGDTVFVDPLQLLLPFKQWEYAVDALTQDENRDVGRARRVLEELASDGEITEEQYAQALESEEGPAWERAIMLARLDDTEGRTSAFDFMSMLTAPHAPIAWAHQFLKGTPEEIRTFLPLTRTVKGVTALLGIGPAGGVNIEGNIREHLGLPRVDQYDDYRTNRMLSNMVGDGEITAQQAGLAMTSQQGEHYEEAKRRAGIEYGIGALGSTLGIPLKAYPPGEEHLRKLKDDYEAAWVEYEAGNDTALNDFYRDHPDYESRQLALEFEPEEQLRRFLIDEVWNKWHDLPVQHKRDVADGLGGVFQTAFLDRDTRSTDNISSDMLQVWLQIMGGETPGKAEWDQDLHPLELTPPVIAQRLDAFYLTRSQNFRYNDNVAPLWDDYFKLDKAARKKYFRDNPILKQYLDWRNDFMIRNPDLAPYIEDDPEDLPVYESLEELQEAQQAQPNFTWLEWQNVLTIPMWRLARDHLRYGDTLTSDEEEELQDVAEGLGIDATELMIRLQGAYEEAEGVDAVPHRAPTSVGGNGASAAPSIPGGLGRSIGGREIDEDMVQAALFARRVRREMEETWSVQTVDEGIAQIEQGRWQLNNALLGKVVDEGIEAGMQEDESVEAFDQFLNKYAEAGQPELQGIRPELWHILLPGFRFPQA